MHWIDGKEKCGQADDTPVEKCVFSLMNKRRKDYELS